MNIFRCLFTFLFVVGFSAAAPPESSPSSSSAPTIDWAVEFFDPTETFQMPPPTEIRLGELLAESDFVAVVHWTYSFNTAACECSLLHVTRFVAARDHWDTSGLPKPHLLEDARGCDYVIMVSRYGGDIFTHGDNFDQDAYNGPDMSPGIPYLLLGKVRPVSEEQANGIGDALPETRFESEETIQLGFEIGKTTPVRPVQGLRGLYPLVGIEQAIAASVALGGENSRELLRSFDYKYLIQTYGEPDAIPLVQAINTLLTALSKDHAQASESLGALTEDPDPVISSAAEYLLELKTLPRFLFKHPVPLPLSE